MPIVILIVLKGGTLLFACLLALISAIGIAEFYLMALPERKLELWLAALAGSALIFIPLAGNDKLILSGISLLFVGFSLLFITLHLAAMRNEILRRRVRSLQMMQASQQAA